MSTTTLVQQVQELVAIGVSPDQAVALLMNGGAGTVSTASATGETILAEAAKNDESAPETTVLHAIASDMTSWTVERLRLCAAKPRTTAGIHPDRGLFSICQAVNDHIPSDIAFNFHDYNDKGRPGYGKYVAGSGKENVINAIIATMIEYPILDTNSTPQTTDRGTSNLPDGTKTFTISVAKPAAKKSQYDASPAAFALRHTRTMENLDALRPIAHKLQADLGAIDDVRRHNALRSTVKSGEYWTVNTIGLDSASAKKMAAHIRSDARSGVDAIGEGIWGDDYNRRRGDCFCNCAFGGNNCQHTSGKSGGAGIADYVNPLRLISQVK